MFCLGRLNRCLQTLELSGKGCQGPTLAYYENSSVTDEKSFITLGPGRLSPFCVASLLPLKAKMKVEQHYWKRNERSKMKSI